MAWSHLERQGQGRILFQPHNRDTGPGVFLPLTYVRAWNPDATVVLFPSDHFIFPEGRFLAQVKKAVQATDWLRDRLILLGLAPSTIEIEYGWIEPSEILGWCQGFQVRGVKSFLEKPDRVTALKAMARGALWNTMVLVAKVETLWQMGWSCFPEVMVRFEELAEAMGTSREGSTLQAMYHDMPRKNFSSDLLQRIPDRVGVVELHDIMWSDWGQPARIVETLRQIGKEPSFNRNHVVGSAPRLDLSTEQLTEVP